MGANQPETGYEPCGRNDQIPFCMFWSLSILEVTWLNLGLKNHREIFDSRQIHVERATKLIRSTGEENGTVIASEKVCKYGIN